MKTKRNQSIVYSTIALSLGMMAIGAWGVLNSYSFSNLWHSVGTYQTQALAAIAGTYYFSYGAFTVVLMTSIFVLFTALQDNKFLPRT